MKGGANESLLGLNAAAPRDVTEDTWPASSETDIGEWLRQIGMGRWEELLRFNATDSVGELLELADEREVLGLFEGANAEHISAHDADIIWDGLCVLRDGPPEGLVPASKHEAADREEAASRSDEDPDEDEVGC